MYKNVQNGVSIAKKKKKCMKYSFTGAEIIYDIIKERFARNFNMMKKGRKKCM